MLPLYFWISYVFLAFARGDPKDNGSLRDQYTQTSEPDLQQIRSPLLEVFLHLSPNFREVRSFGSTLGVRSQRSKRASDPEQVVANGMRTKKQDDDRQKVSEEPKKLPGDHPMLPVPDAIRGPNYSAFPVKEFDVVDIDDPDDARRRRTESSNGPEDGAQRDKRTFLEEASAETTTLVPFWKRKKENPPFVTGRQSGQNGNGYTPAQHRSAENTRESHSLKNLDKTVQSNEISRSNQDNYYSATNRRTYSRQYDGPSSSSTPKSVYDTIDYGAKRNTEPPDDPKSPARRPTPATHEHYTHRHPLYHPHPYPYPVDVIGRGVEYYHRTFDPSTGRVVYYANMPEQPRSPDSVHRSLYLPDRPFGPFSPYHPFHPFDPYYRSYVPPFDYRFLNGYVNGYSNNYIRSGRSGAQAYSHPFQEREKFQRDARFVGGFDASNRFRDESRNKTYIIYDADESRSQYLRAQSQYGADVGRFSFTPSPLDIPSRPPPASAAQGQRPFKQFPFPPTADHFPPSAFSNRNSFYSSAPSPDWGFGHRGLSGVAEPKTHIRPLHSPEVQLPLTTVNRDFDGKSKKS